MVEFFGLRSGRFLWAGAPFFFLFYVFATLFFFSWVFFLQPTS